MIRKKKKKKVTGPSGPVIIACHWPELARRLQIAGGPAGQCLLWRPGVTAGQVGHNSSFFKVVNPVCFQRSFTFSVSVGSTVEVTPSMTQAVERKLWPPRMCTTSTACRWRHGGRMMKRLACVVLQNNVNFMRNSFAIIRLKHEWCRLLGVMCLLLIVGFSDCGPTT